MPGGRAAAIAAAILAAGVVGGVTGASFADRSGSQTTTTVQATASPPPASQALPNSATSLTDAVRTASPSVVAVRSSFGQGSGVIVDDRGLVVTNHHVIAGDSTVGIETADGRLVSADVVADDPQQDLAVLRPVDDVGPGATIASEPNGGLVVGDQVFAIGNPFGLRNTVTSGIVSFVDRPADGGTPMIQTDAPINPGNSGGGLFDLRGQLVGIPTSIRAPIQGNVGIGFAVPVSRVSALLRRVQ